MGIEVIACPNTGVNKHFKEGEYYYQSVVDGKKCSFIAETEDMALLIGLGVKYDGINTQFPKMAARMLNIKTVWSE